MFVFSARPFATCLRRELEGALDRQYKELLGAVKQLHAYLRGREALSAAGKDNHTVFFDTSQLVVKLDDSVGVISGMFPAAQGLCMSWRPLECYIPLGSLLFLSNHTNRHAESVQ